MKWSPQQERAIADVSSWLRDPSRQVFRLFGFAGTGKTTLARHLAADVSGEVVFAAFTGKAAYVLQRAGCEGATTLHSLIYQPKDKSRERLLYLQRHLQEIRQTVPVDEDRVRKGERLIDEEKKNLRRPSFVLKLDSPVADAGLLVVDECSMVDERMGRDILSYGTKVLVLGDPAQLPPVFGGGYFTNGDPDVMLTEIHRQARDNPIVDMATRIREGESLDYGRFGESRVVRKSEITPDGATSADQILVGTNKLRRATNRRCRELRGRAGTFPERGDRLVCLRNDHDVGLLNGSIWTVEENHGADDETNKLDLTLSGEDGGSVTVTTHTQPFEGVEVPYWDRRDAQEFEFGYALTCHKAQGSQWKDVLIFDESRVFGKDRRRWLYTAVTRAAERVTVAK